MTIDTDHLRALAQKMPNLDWDSNMTPFYNDAEGNSRGGNCDGTYCVYGEDFEIDGEQYDGPTLIERCNKDQAEFICQAKPTILALLDELDRLREQLNDASDLLRHIGDYAHDRSAGPAVPDDLWEVRRMAYDGFVSIGNES